MVLRRYTFQEALNRILRALKGTSPSDDTPDQLSGGMLNVEDAASEIAELLQNSYPGVTPSLPQYIVINSGSYSASHFAQHLHGIGEQRLGNAENHIYVDEDGKMTLVGSATVFKDMSVPLTRTALGANDLPHFDYTNIGLLFPQNDTSEKVYFTIQFQHDKKLNSSIYPHVHYIQSVTGTPIFKYTYRWYNNNGNVTTAWTTGSTADGSRAVFTRVSGNFSQIASFPAIDFQGGAEFYSSNLDIILWREDNVVTGDVLAKFVDVHYESNSMGSDTLYA